MLILPDPTADRTPSGLVMVQQTPDKQTIGTVVATGPGRVDQSGAWIAVTCQKGDRVAYGKYSGTKITIDDVEHEIMDIDQVFGVFREGSV